MSSYYTDYSFIVKMTEEQWGWVDRLVKELDDPSVGNIVYDTRNDGAWFYSDHAEGESDLDVVADILQAFLARFHVAEKPSVITFEWANSCSKPRLGAFSGGGCVVTKDEIFWVVPGNIMRNKVKELASED